MFSLAEIDRNLFDSIVKNLARLEEPSWPVWMPRWKFASAIEERQTRDSLEKDLNKAKDATLVIATNNIAKEIILCLEIGPDARRHLPPPGQLPGEKDWPYWKKYLTES
jgi:hypothetical protein